MIAVLSDLAEPFRLGLIQRALLEALLVSALTGPVGSLLVLRGLSFSGESLAHTVFPGIVTAYLLGASLLLGGIGMAGVTVLLTLILTRRQDVLAEDTAVGVVFAGLFPAGVLLFALQANVDRSLDSFLFGDLLGVSGDDLVGSTLLILLGLAILAGTYRPLVATSYGRAFTSSLGYRPLVVDAVLLALVALCMVVAMQAIGNVLASALLIVPAATSRLLSRRLLPMMLLAAALGGGACLGGIELSYWCGLAGGSAVVLCAAAAFAVTLGARLLGGGLARTPSGAAALP